MRVCVHVCWIVFGCLDICVYMHFCVYLFTCVCACVCVLSACIIHINGLAREEKKQKEIELKQNDGNCFIPHWLENWFNNFFNFDCCSHHRTIVAIVLIVVFLRLCCNSFNSCCLRICRRCRCCRGRRRGRGRGRRCCYCYDCLFVCCPHIRVPLSLWLECFYSFDDDEWDGKEKCVVVQIRDELFPRHTQKTSKLNWSRVSSWSWWVTLFSQHLPFSI